MEDLVDYKEKYLKYKLKYFELKSHLEGGSLTSGIKQTYKFATGKYSDEIKEINHILNKTVYLLNGDIIESYGYNPNQNLQGARMLYTNTDLVQSSLEQTNDETTPVEDINSGNFQVNKEQDLNQLPYVNSFLKAVKERIKVYKNNKDKDEPDLIKYVYASGIKSLERILNIHYMCKGASGILKYKVKECFENIHTKQKRNELQMVPQGYQYGQPQGYQYGQDYRQPSLYGRGDLTQAEYKQKYYKYKAKYYQLVEQNGGLIKDRGILSSLKQKANSATNYLKSVKDSAKSTGSKLLFGYNEKSPDEVKEILKDIENLENLKKIDISIIKKGITEEQLKKILNDIKEEYNKKITSINKLTGLLPSCKTKSSDKTYDNERCFPGTNDATTTAATTTAPTPPTETATATTTATTLA